MTYMALGVIFGLIGLGLQINGFQSHLSIFTGLFVLAFVFLPKIQKTLNHLVPRGFLSGIQSAIARRLKKKSYLTIFSIGIFNGLLPCGLIYIALIAAMETGFVEMAALYMFLFGLGTSVILLAIHFTRDLVIRWKPHRMRRLIPYFTVFLGLLFITRGVLFMLPVTTNNQAIDILKTITLCHVTP